MISTAEVRDLQGPAQQQRAPGTKESPALAASKAQRGGTPAAETAPSSAALNLLVAMLWEVRGVSTPREACPLRQRHLAQQRQLADVIVIVS